MARETLSNVDQQLSTNNEVTKRCRWSDVIEPASAGLVSRGEMRVASAHSSEDKWRVQHRRGINSTKWSQAYFFPRIGMKSGRLPHRTRAVEIATTKPTMIIESTMSASSAVKHLRGRRVEQSQAWDLIPVLGETVRPRRRARCRRDS